MLQRYIQRYRYRDFLYCNKNWYFHRSDNTVREIEEKGIVTSHDVLAHVSYPDKGKIAYVECLDTSKRRRFNGRLIAAAPEMYDWLKVFVRLFADNPNINISCIQKLLESIEDDDFDKEIEVHE